MTPSTAATLSASASRSGRRDNQGGWAWLGTPAQVRALGVTTTVPAAASILGIGRTLAYELVGAGWFPVPVIRAGGAACRAGRAAASAAGHQPRPFRRW